MFLLCCACNTVLIPKAWLNGCCWNNYCKKVCTLYAFFFLLALNTTKCWNVQCESVLLSNRLCVLATPDAVVSSPVAQLSIPINGNFEILRGMSSVWITVSQIPQVFGKFSVYLRHQQLQTICCFCVFFCKVFLIPVQGMQVYCYCFLKIVSQCCKAALRPNLEMQRNSTGLCYSGGINVTEPIVWC